MDPFRTAMDVFVAKTGLHGAHEPTEPMLWGCLHEELVAKVYEAQWKLAFPDSPILIRKPPAIRSVEFPFMVGHLDFICSEPAGGW
jgi:hypothetical protein